MAKLDDPLRGVLGDKTAKPLASGLDLLTVGDLLHHYPRRYARRGDLTDLARLRDGEHVTVMGEVQKVQGRTITKRPGYLLEITVTDGSGQIKLTFFGRKGSYTAERELTPGTWALFSGKVGVYRPSGGIAQLRLTHPEYKIVPVKGVDVTAQEYADEIIPIYPAAKGIDTWQIADSVAVVLDTLDLGAESLPPAIRLRYGLIGLQDAYEGVHRPRDDRQIAAARRRLKWDEAFLVQVALAQRRLRAARLPARAWPPSDTGLLAAFDRRLPFELTAGQRAVGAEIAAELAREHPMHRLLQGDVGSGKTIVALRAMLQVAGAGGQAALLAPTEVLAQQHFHSITAMLGPLAEAGRLGGTEQSTRVVLLTGSQGAKARRAALLDAASGAAGIVVGTHALLQEHVKFADLGLVVVDEQHRFGVEQRDALREKVAGGRPHVLVMTATPIPRTVAMTVFGDLETSVLTELPAGRAGIGTHVVPAERPHYLARAWERIGEEAAAGRQAYIVCPRIGEEPGDAPAGSSATRDSAGPPGEDDDLPGADEAAGDRAERRPPLAVLDVLPLLTERLPELRVGVLHGRLPADEKESVMRRFAAGELDVLLATTVIEVGVDVPNATVMMIMDADRFGVSQLHQLRGRVGRGGHPGLCLLVTDAPDGMPARRRLDAVAATTDGFELSRLDLEQRREGDVLGAAQAGRTRTLRLLTLLRDEEVIVQARDEATRLVAADPELARAPVLAAELATVLDEDQAEYLDKA